MEGEVCLVGVFGKKGAHTVPHFKTVRAELVEALPFFCERLEEERQHFDKLSANG